MDGCLPDGCHVSVVVRMPGRMDIYVCMVIPTCSYAWADGHLMRDAKDGLNLIIEMDRWVEELSLWCQ